MTIKEKFLADLNDAATVCHWGDTVRLTFTDGRDPMCNYLLADLAAIDDRLPVAIPAMALENGINDRFDAEWLRNTLTFWRGDSHFVIPSQDIVGLIPEIGYMRYENNVDRFVSISMFAYFRHRVEGVQFIARNHWGAFNVLASDLDEQFPGWRIRFQVLKALDMPHREVIDGALSREHISSAPSALPDQDLTA